MSVGEAFEKERPSLIALPDNPFLTDERIEASVGKTPYVRFDLNDYSVPHTCVRRVVSISASLDTVRVLDGETEIARHARSYDKGAQIEHASHIDELVDFKRQARYQRGQQRLARAAPASVVFLQLAATRGHRLASLVGELERLLEQYPGGELEAALNEAIERDVVHLHAVRQVLEQRREARDEPPPVGTPVTTDEQVRRLVVRPASLAAYAHLSERDEEGSDNDER